MAGNHKFDMYLLERDPRYRKLHGLHEFLDMQIRQLMQHPAADLQEIKILKRRKLLVVDQMQKMQAY